MNDRMKRFFLIALLALIPLVTISAQFRSGASYDDLYDSETVAAIKNHVRHISAASLEGRKAGSEGEREAAAYVTEILKS